MGYGIALAAHAEAGIKETFILPNWNDDGQKRRLEGGGEVLEKESASLDLNIEDAKGHESYPIYCPPC